MYQTGFTDKEIKLTFDEYVVLKDPAKQFFISPPLKTKAFPMPKGKSVVIKLEDQLDAKTTYTVGFGNSVVDNNEGNPIQNLQLVFSTGSKLDTLAVDGFLFDAHTLKVPEGVKVFIYKDKIDSLPYIANPNYYTYADKNGYFRVPNVPAGEYKLVAVSDKNDNLRYDQNAEQVGYISTPISARAKQPVDSVTKSTSDGKLPILRMFTEDPINLTLLDATRPKSDLVKLVFSKKNPELPKLVFSTMEKDPFVIEHSRNNDTVLFWITNANLIKSDTLKALLTYLYTGEKRVLEYKTKGLELAFESHKEQKDKNKEPKRLPGFNPTFIGVELGVVPTIGVDLTFPNPPTTTDPSRITLSAKTEKDSLAQAFTIENTTLPRSLRLNVDWKENTKYFYTILPGAFVSASGIENDTIIGTINVALKENFGTIILKATGIESPVILQFISDKGILFSELSLKSDANVILDYIPEGSYKLKILFDENDNQHWDGGDLIKGIQPEMVKYYRSTDEKEIFVVKKNWENEIPLDLKKILNN